MNNPTSFALVNEYDPNVEYWDSHPAYPRSDWIAEVESNATSLGYWDIVATQLGLIDVEEQIS